MATSLNTFIIEVEALEGVEDIQMICISSLYLHPS